MKRVAGIVLLALALAGAFVWGFATERYRIFPIAWIRRGAVLVGLRGWSQPVDMNSASPALAALKSVPYLSGAIDPNAKAKGVVEAVPGEVAPGVNFYSTLGRGDAFVVDGSGRLLWRWSLGKLLSDFAVKPGIDFGYTHLFPNGDVIAYVGERGIYRLDRDSRLLWSHAAPAHHDAFVADDGEIYALVHATREVPAIDPRHPLLLDVVVVLSPEGDRRRSISIFDAIQSSTYAFLLPRTAGLALPPGTDAVDVLHTNHVEVYDGSLESKSPLFRRGNLLLSMKNLNAIAILDGRTTQVLWLWGPTNLTLQHHPTILENGDVLLFDNGTARSQIVEVDPRTNAVTWRYAPEKDFFSDTRGACQRLPNGNTLVTLSQTGYAVEVTADGRTVWKFANPAVTPEGFRDGIYRMTRLSAASLPFLPAPAAR
ncbi:MAG: arylsulfotransferase family protein [Syntrophomonadaceae bacterium]